MNNRCRHWLGSPTSLCDRKMIHCLYIHWCTNDSMTSLVGDVIKQLWFYYNRASLLVFTIKCAANIVFYGSVGTAVASDTRDPLFDSNYRQYYLLSTVLKRRKWIKRGQERPIFNILFYGLNGLLTWAMTTFNEKNVFFNCSNTDAKFTIWNWMITLTLMGRFWLIKKQVYRVVVEAQLVDRSLPRFESSHRQTFI